MFLLKETWIRLDNTERDAWNKLSEETKAKIIGVSANGEKDSDRNRERTSSRPSRKPSDRKSSSRKAYIHDLINELTTIGEENDNDDKPDDDENLQDNEDETNVIDVFTAAVHEGKFDDHSPAYPAKMMSASLEKAPPNAKSTPKQQTTERKANKTQSIYHVLRANVLLPTKH